MIRNILPIFLALFLVSTIINAQTPPGIVQSTIAPQAAGVPVMLNAMTSTLGATPFAIKNSAGNLYGWEIYNAAGSVCFLQVFNGTAASVMLGTTTPVVVMGVNNGQTTGLVPVAPVVGSSTGLSAAFTTTATGSSACGTTASATFFYQ